MYMYIHIYIYTYVYMYMKYNRTRKGGAVKNILDIVLNINTSLDSNANK